MPKTVVASLDHVDLLTETPPASYTKRGLPYVSTAPLSALPVTHSQTSGLNRLDESPSNRHLSYMTATRRKMVVCATWLLCFATTRVEAATPVYRIPIVDDGVQLADLLDVALTELGLSIRVSGRTLNQSIPVQGVRGTALLTMARAVLEPMGLTLRPLPAALEITVDRSKVRARWNDLEAWLRTRLGKPPIFALRRIESDASGPPIVLVHGIDNTVERLRGAGQALAKRGYDTYLYEYPNDTDIERIAIELGALLRGVYRRTGVKVTVVSTSMGGVITRTWLELPINELRPPEQRTEVQRFIACVPPFHGAEIARYHLVSEFIQVLGDALIGRFSELMVWDGLGQAATDLTPGSELLTRFEATQRRTDVKYSILAGRGAILPEAVFTLADELITTRQPEAGPIEKLAWEFLGEIAGVARAVGGGKGDGVVPIASTRLHGVDDHVVTEMNHFDCLSGTERRGRQIPGLAQVLTRLPAIQ